MQHRRHRSMQEEGAQRRRRPAPEPPPAQPGSLTEKLNGSIGLVLCLCDLSADIRGADGMRVW